MDEMLFVAVIVGISKSTRRLVLFEGSVEPSQMDDSIDTNKRNNSLLWLLLLLGVFAFNIILPENYHYYNYPNDLLCITFCSSLKKFQPFWMLFNPITTGFIMKLDTLLGSEVELLLAVDLWGKLSK